MSRSGSDRRIPLSWFALLAFAAVPFQVANAQETYNMPRVQTASPGPRPVCWPCVVHAGNIPANSIPHGPRELAIRRRVYSTRILWRRIVDALRSVISVPECFRACHDIHSRVRWTAVCPAGNVVFDTQPAGAFTRGLPHGRKLLLRPQGESNSPTVDQRFQLDRPELSQLQVERVLFDSADAGPPASLAWRR